MRIAIVDDNSAIAQEVYEQLRILLQNKQVEYRVFNSGDDYMSSGFEPDYVFLDIEMPGSDGICVKEENEKSGRGTKIIFLSSMESRMREAFGNGVLGFLTKPLNVDELKVMVDKFEDPAEGKCLEFDLGDRILSIPVKDILYIEASDKYTDVHLKTGAKHCLRVTIKEWLELLPDSLFGRAGKSYIVHYSLCDNGLKEIPVPDGAPIVVGRAFKDSLKEGYRAYLLKR